MSEKVTTLLDITLRRSHYNFLLINESDFNTDIERSLKTEGPVFGKNIGWRGRLIQAFAGNSKEVTDEVLAKRWPAEIRDRIGDLRETLILIINVDFPAFDPNSNANEWFIVWLSALDRPSRVIPHMFDVLYDHVRRDQNLFKFLRSKLDNPDPTFPHGSLETRGVHYEAPPPRKNKRVEIIHPERGLSHEVAIDLIKHKHIDLKKHGEPRRLAEEAKEWLRKNRQIDVLAKSVQDAMNKAGWLPKKRSKRVKAISTAKR